MTNPLRSAAQSVLDAAKMQNLPSPSGRAKSLALMGLMITDAQKDKGMVRKAQLALAHQQFRDAALLFHQEWCESPDGPKRLYAKLAAMQKDGNIDKIPVMSCPSCFRAIKVKDVSSDNAYSG